MSEAAAPPLVVVDMGRRKPKAVKKLRKGEGKAFDEVLEAIAEMRADGVLRDDAQTVVVIVERRPKLPFGL